MNQTSRKTISRKERDQIFDAFGKHISKGQIRYLTAGHLDILEGDRDGIRFQESQSGKSYIDGFSSAGCFNVGRSNPQIIRKLEAAVDDYDMGTYGMLSAPKIRLAKLLADMAPGDLNRVLLCGTGADAIEGALKLARAATGRNEIISMLKAYHGHSGMSLSANGVAGRFALRIGLDVPGKYMRHLKCPALICVSSKDSVAPAGPTMKFAKGLPNVDVRVYDAGHFDIYVGEFFETIVKDQVAFLCDKLL